MTKSQKKLGHLKLTDEERKELDKYYRLQDALDFVILILSVIAAIIVVICTMELFS